MINFTDMPYCSNIALISNKYMLTYHYQSLSSTIDHLHAWVMSLKNLHSWFTFFFSSITYYYISLHTTLQCQRCERWHCRREEKVHKFNMMLIWYHCSGSKNDMRHMHMLWNLVNFNYNKFWQLYTKNNIYRMFNFSGCQFFF
jgi:hypothetical protein